MKFTAKATFRPRSSAGQFIQAYINPGVVASVEAVTQRIFDVSQDLVPVDTGALKASGQMSIDDSGKTVVGTVDYTADYADYVEYGTGIRGADSADAGSGPYNPNWPGMPAQPYLRPALDEVKGASLDMFKGQIATGLNG